MKKIILSGLFFVLASCTNSPNTPIPDQNSPSQQSDFIVDVAKLSSARLDLNEVSGTIAGALSLGEVTESEVTKVLVLRNSSSAAVPVSLQMAGEGYSIKLNRCGSSLAAGTGCRVTISFKNRGLYDGDYVGTLSVTDSPEDLILNLSAHISNRPDPNTGQGSLEVSMSAPFYSSSNVMGKMITRDVTVKNLGPGNVPSVAITLDPAYLIRINRCGSLKVNQSCVIQVMYKNYRSSVPAQASTGNILASAPNVSSPVGLVLSSNQPADQQPPTSYKVRFEIPEDAQVKTSVLGIVEFISGQSVIGQSSVIVNYGTVSEIDVPAGSNIQINANWSQGDPSHPDYYYGSFKENGQPASNLTYVVNSTRTFQLSNTCNSSFGASPSQDGLSCVVVSSGPNLSMTGCSYSNSAPLGDPSHTCYGSMVNISLTYDQQTINQPNARGSLFADYQCSSISSGTYSNNGNPFFQNLPSEVYNLNFDGWMSPPWMQGGHNYAYVIYSPQEGDEYAVDQVYSCIDLGYIFIDSMAPQFNQMPYVVDDMNGLQNNYFIGSTLELGWNLYDNDMVDTVQIDATPYGIGYGGETNGTVSLSGLQDNTSFNVSINASDRSGNQTGSYFIQVNYIGANPVADSTFVEFAGNGRVSYDGGSPTVTGRNFFSVTTNYGTRSTEMIFRPQSGMPAELICPPESVIVEDNGQKISCNNSSFFNENMPFGGDSWCITLRHPFTYAETQAGCFDIAP